jgi:Ser-tRNA(Ala) deacylase AlaX
VKVEMVHTKEEVERLCGSADSHSSPSPTEPVRVVTVCAPLGCPCGGTHVQNTSEIGHMTIPKMSARKGVVRISYTLA